MALIGTKQDIINYYNEQERDMFGNRTWSNARANLSYGYELASAQLQKEFGDQVAAAYQANLQQRADVLGSNLGIGAQKSMLSAADMDIAQAYNAYLANYSTAKQDLMSETQTLYEGIDTTISSLADQQLSLDEQIAEYYKFLTTNYADVLMNDKMFQKYLTDEVLVDAEGNPILDDEGNIQYVTDEEGNIKKRFKTLTELDEVLANEVTDEEGNIYKEWQGFHDAEGNITPFGQDYYDLMLNYFSGHSGAPSFEDFLRKNYDEVDEKTQAQRESVYDFMKSYNPYTLHDLESNTQLGSFKTMVGMTSTDYTYTFMERFGGWSQGEVKALFKDFEDKLAEMKDWSGYDMKDKATKNIGYVKDIVQDLAKVASDLGISEKDIGVSWTDLSDALANYENTAHTGGEMAEEALLSIGQGAIAGTVAAGLYTAPTELLPGIGQISHGTAMGLGAIGGAIMGLGAVLNDIEMMRQDNYRWTNLARNAYERALQSIIEYSMAKHAAINTSFNNR